VGTFDDVMQTGAAAGVDLSGVSRREDAAEADALPSEYLRVPGFIDRVIDYNLATAHKPQPALALAGALALQAVLCSRKIVSASGARPNIYICGVAPSGAGKDHARRVNKKVLRLAGLSQLQAEGLRSGSAPNVPARRVRAHNADDARQQPQPSPSRYCDADACAL